MIETARRKPAEAPRRGRLARRPALPRRAPQHRGRAGAARRHPRQQRGARPRLGLPRAAPLLRSAAPADLRDRCQADRLGQAGDADHAQDLLRERRADRRRPHRAAVSGPARRQRRHHHQRARLRPHHPRPRHPPPADPDRRGHGQRGLRLARSTSRPRSRSRRPRRGCSRWPRPDKYGQGFLDLQHGADARHRDGQQRLQARRAACPASPPRFAGLDGKMGGLQPSDLIVLAGRPSMGKTALATNIAFNVARARAQLAREPPELQPDDPAPRRRRRRLLLARNVGRAARHPHPVRAGRHSLGEDPPRHDRRGRVQAPGRGQPGDGQPSRCSSTRPAASRSPSSSARARRLKRQHGLGLIVVDYLQLMTGTSSKSDNRVQEVSRDHHRPQGAGQGAERAGHRAVAALARGREPRGQAAAARRTCANRAPSSRTPTSSCSCSARSIIWSAPSRRRARSSSRTGWPRCSSSAARPR